MGKASRRKHEKHASMGDNKLSDALWEVVAPFKHDDLGPDATRKLLAIGAGAWNISLLPADRVKAALSALIDEFCPPTGPTAAADYETETRNFGMLVLSMIKRKVDRFAQDRRFIVNLEIAERAGNLEITVTSATKAAEGLTKDDLQ